MGYVLLKLVDLYMWLIIIRAVLSWIPHKITPLDLLLHRLTEPVLYPIRRILPPVGGRVDFSPMFAGAIAFFIQSII
jgi:YggT family protein